MNVKKVKRIVYADGYEKFVSVDGDEQLQTLSSYSECVYSWPFGQLKEATYIDTMEPVLVEIVPITSLPDRIKLAIKNAQSHMDYLDKKARGVKVSAPKRNAVDVENVKSVNDLFV